MNPSVGASLGLCAHISFKGLGWFLRDGYPRMSPEKGEDLEESEDPIFMFYFTYFVCLTYF